MTPEVQIGSAMLWFDHHEDRTPAEKPAPAIKYYSSKKYPGQTPDICLIAATDHWDVDCIDGIRIQSSKVLIAPGHFMLAQLIRQSASEA